MGLTDNLMPSDTGLGVRRKNFKIRKIMQVNKFSALLLLAASLCGCSESGGDNTIYIPNAGAIVKANFYITDEPDVRSFTVKVTPRSYPELTAPGLSSEATIYLAADIEKVESYNLAHNTEYLPLPEGCVSVSESVTISAGSNESEPVMVSVDAKDNIEPFKEYLLPVSIIDASGIDRSDCCQTVYFLYRGSLDASSMILLDRSGWTVLEASSEEPREGDWGHSGLKEACIDGDLNTFWGTDWATTHPQPPHWIVVDLGTTTHIQGVAVQAREEGYDGPKTMTLEVSDNGSDWSMAGEFKDIPAAGQFRSFLPEAVEGRYIRLTITSVNGGPHVTVSEFHLF